jgi:prepilin-type N-terminal cleavage/methylation domain-containing protein
MNGQTAGRRLLARRHPPAECGFSLPELLLALALGLTLATVAIQGLRGASEGGGRWMLQLRERQVSRRTLVLLRDELGMARDWESGPESGRNAECSLGGRIPVLSLETRGRTITYSVGSAPSRIWRGTVLMRCGPAYDLSGGLSGGQALNRVVLDGLDADGLEVNREGAKVLKIQLKRNVRFRAGMSLVLRDRIVALMPEA